MRPQVDTTPPDAEAALLARCYRLILSWRETETTTPAEPCRGEAAGVGSAPDASAPGAGRITRNDQTE